MVIFWGRVRVGTNVQHSLRINVTYDFNSIRCLQCRRFLAVDGGDRYSVYSTRLRQ